MEIKAPDLMQVARATRRPCKAEKGLRTHNVEKIEIGGDKARARLHIGRGSEDIEGRAIILDPGKQSIRRLHGETRCSRGDRGDAAIQIDPHMVPVRIGELRVLPGVELDRDTVGDPFISDSSPVEALGGRPGRRILNHEDDPIGAAAPRVRETELERR